MPRADVVEALGLLADESVHTRWESAPFSSPTFRDAVAWLIDDTWLDVRPIQAADGDLSYTDQEAAAVQHAVDLLIIVLDDVGPTGPVADVLAHPKWAAVATAADAALRELLSSPA